MTLSAMSLSFLSTFILFELCVLQALEWFFSKVSLPWHGSLASSFSVSPLSIYLLDFCLLPHWLISVGTQPIFSFQHFLLDNHSCHPGLPPHSIFSLVLGLQSVAGAYFHYGTGILHSIHLLSGLSTSCSVNWWEGFMPYLFCQVWYLAQIFVKKMTKTTPCSEASNCLHHT